MRPDEPLAGAYDISHWGPAQWLVTPRSEDEVAAVVSTCEAGGVPWRVLGLGSNVPAPDEGLDGVTLLLADNFCGRRGAARRPRAAAAGATNAAVAAVARDTGLAGYEFASGIPGTVGGAAIMNAGAYEGQFSDVAVEVRCLVPDGNSWSIVSVPAAEANWGYRTSRHDARGLGGAQGPRCSCAPTPLPPSPRAWGRAARAPRASNRWRCRAPAAPSSAPEGHFAGRSSKRPAAKACAWAARRCPEKHAGFVVNTGDATAADVLALIAEVQRRVRQTTGVELEPEVRLVAVAWQQFAGGPRVSTEQRALLPFSALPVARGAFSPHTRVQLAAQALFLSGQLRAFVIFAGRATVLAHVDK